MPDAQTNAIIDQSIRDSVVSRPSAGDAGYFLLRWLVNTNATTYPWWSEARDAQLRAFWKTSDHIGGTVYTMESKMSSIPFLVKARDQSNKEHVAEAEDYTIKLMNGAEWGEGWGSFFERWVEDLITQDNGGFAEIIGAGNPAGPLIGAPVTIRHLDAARCQRTGDPVYPVIYRDVSGKNYKLHSSRVLYKSQMSSTIQEMYGVGFSAVSRCLSVATNLVDILTYKQEKLGSRPRRAVMVAGGGLDPEAIAEAFSLVEGQEDQQGLSRYSKIALVGNSALPDAKIELIDLASLPDGFDEETSFNLGIAVIALAFGLDARELAPALTSGATRADALIQHLKQRGKGPGQIIQTTESLFNFKFLPPYLQMVFDFQDDEQDRQAAETKEIRSRRWNTAITSGTMDSRTAREQMLEVGDLERSQFEQLELADGRLADGADVTALFVSEDPDIKRLLRLPGLDATELLAGPSRKEAQQETNSLMQQQAQPPVTKQVEEDGSNGEESQEGQEGQVLEVIRKQMIAVQSTIVNGKTQEERWRGMQALAALKALEERYTPPPAPPIPPSPNKPGSPPTKTEHDNRIRKVNPTTPNRVGIRMDDELKPQRDDEAKESDGDVESPFRR